MTSPLCYKDVNIVSKFYMLPVRPTHNKTEHRGVSKYVCLSQTHLDTHCYGNTDSAGRPEWHLIHRDKSLQGDLMEMR